MKTILKFLNLFIIILIATLTIDAFAKIFSIIHFYFDNSNKLIVRDRILPPGWSNLNTTLFLVFSIVLIFFLVYLAIIFRQTITSFSQNSYFSNKNVKQLFKVGKGLILYGIGVFFLNLILEYFQFEYSSYNLGLIIGKSIEKSISIFIFSFFILLMASIIEKGYFLKQENELTI